jgi:TIGR03009 family protein
MPRSYSRLAAFAVPLLILAASTAVAQQDDAYSPAPYGDPGAGETVYDAAAAQSDASEFSAVPPQTQQPVTPVTPATTPVAAQAAAQPNQLPGQAAGQTLVQPGAAAAPAAPAPPFVLNEVEHQYVFQILQMWESESAKVKTYNAKFDRLEYDAVWGPGADRPFIVSTGMLSYSKPDKGSFKIDQIKRWAKTDPKDSSASAAGDFVLQKNEVGEHWVCDGKAVYEYDHRNKQLVVTPIPEEMRGASIVDGPLPFLFGAEAEKLEARYWIRAKESTPDMIWLEAYPRTQGDAANYDSVEIQLERKTMQPKAIQVRLPGGQQRHVYAFRDATVNGKFEAWFGALFSSPRVPLGWSKVMSPASDPTQAANPQAPQQR